MIQEPAQGPNLFGKEIRRPSHLQVRLQELLPGEALAIADRRQSMAPEHVAHIAWAGLVPEFL